MDETLEMTPVGGLQTYEVIVALLNGLAYNVALIMQQRNFLNLDRVDFRQVIAGFVIVGAQQMDLVETIRPLPGWSLTIEKIQTCMRENAQQISEEYYLDPTEIHFYETDMLGDEEDDDEYSPWKNEDGDFESEDDFS